MTDEYTTWKASQSRPWEESVRKTVGRMRQREAAICYDRYGVELTIIKCEVV